MHLDDYLGLYPSKYSLSVAPVRSNDKEVLMLAGQSCVYTYLTYFLLLLLLLLLTYLTAAELRTPTYAGRVTNLSIAVLTGLVERCSMLP